MHKHESLAQVQLILESAKLAWDIFKEFRTKSDVPKQYANMPAPQLQSIQNPSFIPEWFPVPPGQVKLTSAWFPVAPGMNAATNDAVDSVLFILRQGNYVSFIQMGFDLGKQF